MRKTITLFIVAFSLLMIQPTYSFKSSSFEKIAYPDFRDIKGANFEGGFNATDFLQTTDGYLWITTSSGLLRYDGYELKLISLDSEFRVEMNEIELASSGVLWMATNQSGLISYDAKNGVFSRVDTESTSNGLLSKLVHEILIEDNYLWAASQGGLNRLDLDSQEIVPIYLTEKHKETTALLLDSQKQLWVGTQDALYKRVGDSEKFEQIIAQSADGDVTFDFKIMELFEDTSGVIWLGTAQAGLWRYNPKTNFIEQLSDINKDARQVLDIFQVDDEFIWVATLNGIEVRKFDSGELFKRIQRDISISHSLSSNQVNSFFRDESGLVWVGVLGGAKGAQSVNLNNKAILYLRPSTDHANSLSYPSIRAIKTLGNGTMLASSKTEGNIDILDPALGKIGSFNLPILYEEKELNLTANTIVETEANKVWIGTYPAYLVSYNLDTKEKEVFRAPLKIQRHGGILQLKQHPITGDLWMAMSEGLLRFDLKEKKFIPVEQNFNGFFWNLDIDRKGNIWAGNSSGLYRLDFATGKWQHFIGKDKNDDSYFDHAIVGALTDSKDRFWLGTRSNLFLLKDLSGEKISFEPVAERIQTQGSGHHNLIEDDLGNIWIAHITVFNPETYEFTRLTDSDLQNTKSLHTVYDVSDKGHIIYDDAEGLTIIKPELFKPWSYQPSVNIHQVKVDQQVNSLPKEVAEIYPENKSFTLNFNAIDFTQPDSLSYRYRLLGYNESWTMANANERLATYTSLAPGSYTFEVGAMNRALEWSNKVASFEIRVNPDYHQTWWFRTLIAGLIALLLFIIVRWRFQKFAEREYAKNQLILLEERASMSLELVEKKNQLLADVSHELRTPLTVLKLQVEALQHNLEDDVQVSYQALDDKLSDIGRLIGDIYQLSLSDIGALKLNLGIVNLKEQLDSWSYNFEQLVTKNNFDWQFKNNISIDLEVNIDSDSIKQVIENLLSNSTKYTDIPGTVSLVASSNESEVTIVVEDSAPTVTDEELSLIFERLYRVESSRSRATGGSGLGLAICRGLVEAHSGMITATHSELGGVKMVIKLPIDRSEQ